MIILCLARLVVPLPAAMQLVVGARTDGDVLRKPGGGYGGMLFSPSMDRWAQS